MRSLTQEYVYGAKSCPQKNHPGEESPAALFKKVVRVNVFGMFLCLYREQRHGKARAQTRKPVKKCEKRCHREPWFHCFLDPNLSRNILHHIEVYRSWAYQKRW